MKLERFADDSVVWQCLCLTEKCNKANFLCSFCLILQFILLPSYRATSGARKPWSSLSLFVSKRVPLAQKQLTASHQNQSRQSAHFWWQDRGELRLRGDLEQLQMMSAKLPFPLRYKDVAFAEGLFHWIQVALLKFPHVVTLLFQQYRYQMVGARGGVVFKALRTGRSRVRFPMVSLDFFQWHNPSGRNMVLGSTQPLTEMSTRCISWG